MRQPCLNVPPAANIFLVAAEPLNIDHTREEYIIRPQDGKSRFLEILNIKSATALFPGGRTLPCYPYETYGTTKQEMLYSLRYRRSEQDNSIEHLLMPLYQLENRNNMPTHCTLSMELLCCNILCPPVCRSATSATPRTLHPLRLNFPISQLPPKCCPDTQTKVCNGISCPT